MSTESLMNRCVGDGYVVAQALMQAPVDSKRAPATNGSSDFFLILSSLTFREFTGVVGLEESERGLSPINEAPNPL